MRTTCIAFTDELRIVLDHLARDGGTHLGPLIESLLRDVPAVKRVRSELGLAWSERPPRGNLSRPKKILTK